MIRRFFNMVALLTAILFLSGCSPIVELYPVGEDGNYLYDDNRPYSSRFPLSFIKKGDTDFAIRVSLNNVKDLLFVADVEITNLTSETISIQICQSFFLADEPMLQAKRSSIITLDRKTATILFGEYVSTIAERIQAINSASPKHYVVEKYGSISTVSPSSLEELGKSIAGLSASSEMSAVRDLQKDIFIKGLDDINISPHGQISGKVCFLVGYSLKIDYPVHLFMNIKNSSFHILFKKL